MGTQKLLSIVFVLSCAMPAGAAVTITSPTGSGLWHQHDNTVTLSGTATGSVSSVTYACTSGCNNSGTATGTGSWSSGTIFLDGGSNHVTVTSNLSGGGTETATINLYRTIPGSTTVNFPYTLNFDSGPGSLEAMYTASNGATVAHRTAQCWSGGCARFTPATAPNNYAALGGFQFPGTPQRIHIRYLIYFGPDYPSHLDQRHKHIIIHRAGAMLDVPPGDNSDDRGMIYVWHNGANDLGLGACDNTVCRFDPAGGQDRPNASTALLIGQHTAEWISLEAVFDAVAHTASLYATTQNGALNDALIARHTIHATANPAADYWYTLSVLGAFIDIGTTASPGMYFMMDEIVMDDSHIGPPAGFVNGSPPPRARPSAPVLTGVQ